MAVAHASVSGAVRATASRRGRATGRVAAVSPRAAASGAVSAERTVTSPAQALSKGWVPMMPEKITVPGAIADFVEESIADLQNKQIEGSVVDYCLAKGMMGEEDGLICEFGVYQGASIARIAKATEKTVYGFDSFEGFPTDWDLPYGLQSRADFFDQGGEIQNFTKPKNVELVRGFFSDSLPGWMEAHPGNFSLVNIDCDMYTSTADVFTVAQDRFVPGTVITFDEFFCHGADYRGEFTAFYEFLERTGYGFEYICCGQGSHELMLQFPKFGEKAFVDKLFMATMFKTLEMTNNTPHFDTAVALRLTEKP